MDEWIINGERFHLYVERKPIKHAYLRVKKNHVIHVTCGKRFKKQEIVSFVKKHEEKIIKATQRKTLPPYQGTWLIFGEICKHILDPMRLKPIDIENHTVYQKKETPTKKEIEDFYGSLILREVDSFLRDHPIRKKIDMSRVTWKTQLMTSRFGSCHPKKKTIKLNTFLGRLDKQYLHATLLHEIVHLKFADHQKRFYDCLLTYMSNYRPIHRELKRRFNAYEVR